MGDSCAETANQVPPLFTNTSVYRSRVTTLPASVIVLMPRTTAVSMKKSTSWSEGFIRIDTGVMLATSCALLKSCPELVVCMKFGARMLSTVGTSPAVIAVSQRDSCAKTSAHGSGTAAIPGSEAEFAHALAWLNAGVHTDGGDRGWRSGDRKDDECRTTDLGHWIPQDGSRQTISVTEYRKALSICAESQFDSVRNVFLCDCPANLSRYVLRSIG
jgi:hypothetical protein